jgi:hypothetical protein
MPVPTIPNTPPATVAASATYNSGAINTNDAAGIAASAQLSGSGAVGTLTLQRYLDNAATVPIGAAVTAAMTGGIAATVEVNDGTPFGSAILTVLNSSAGVLNLTSVFIRTIAP